MELEAFAVEELEEIDLEYLEEFDLEVEVDLELDGIVEVDQPELVELGLVVVDLFDLVVVVGHCSTNCHLECISLNDPVKDLVMPYLSTVVTLGVMRCECFKPKACKI